MPPIPFSTQNPISKPATSLAEWALLGKTEQKIDDKDKDDSVYDDSDLSSLASKYESKWIKEEMNLSDSQPYLSDLSGVHAQLPPKPSGSNI